MSGGGRPCRYLALTYTRQAGLESGLVICGDVATMGESQSNQVPYPIVPFSLR